MKGLRLLIVIISVCSLYKSYGQIVPIDEKTKLVSFQEVVYQDGGQKELFNRSIRWLNSYYKNPVAVTRERDAESGVIIGKHEFKLDLVGSDATANRSQGVVLYSFKIMFKDGRYRYTMTDIVLKRKSRFPIENFLNDEDPEIKEKYHNYLKQINAFAKEWSESLKQGMKPEEEIQEEEW